MTATVKKGGTLQLSHQLVMSFSCNGLLFEGSTKDRENGPPCKWPFQNVAYHPGEQFNTSHIALPMRIFRGFSLS